MILPSRAIALGLVLVLQASPIQAWKITDRLRVNYVDYDEPDQIIVPSYNISMPVDHFTASDTRTFNNRYFVNDTYYKPGGPVIFYDFGEGGVDDWSAAVLMGGWNGTQSAPLELAKARNGVVIGWEHRYYGYSRPFEVTPAEYDDEGYSSSSAGIPLGGAADYKYLTVAQALEDVVYFANAFNQTRLGGRNTVLAGENATLDLGPWHTPWIWVGGSYPGVRGAWLRLRNPDVIYAVWASSAPVQTVPDGSAYPNSIYRALPANCTADMHAAVSRIDQILDAGNQTQMYRLAVQIGLVENGGSDVKSRSDSDPYELKPDDFKPNLSDLFLALISTAQSDGYTTQLQQFCDMMEGFDVPSFLSNSSAHTDDDMVFIWNDGDASPSAKGIAASNPNGGFEVVLAAYLYAVNGYLNGNLSDYGDKRRRSSAPSTPSQYYDYITPDQDDHSWEWQVLSEMGLVVAVNGTSPYALGSKYVDHAYARANIVTQMFANFSGDEIPAEADNAYPAGFGGWRMAPSNTMFTNGEFDPWRTYGVASLESQLPDYPPSTSMSQDVPQCNSADHSGGHFGLVYPGAVHTEDIYSGLDVTRGSQNTTDTPLKQGLELFLQALDVWLPCFNSSRGQVAAVDPNNPATNSSNSTNSTGPGKKSGASPGSSAVGGVWAVVGVFLFVFYHAL